MGRAVEPIPMTELADNLEEILDHVVNDQAEVVVETARGQLAVLRPLRRKTLRRAKTEADDSAFLSSAGGWAEEVDVEAFKKANAEARRRSSRPPVDL